MLRRLQIRDFAIIDELQLELASGFTVLSGETGAGKSILIDALGLLLGDRADTAMVRAGAERAEIEAEVDLQGLPGVQQWLSENGLDDHDEPQQCLLRRQVLAEGRTRAFINGRSVPVANLRDLGEQLVEIHGQHDHQRLTQAAVQRELLDEYGAHSKELAELAAAHLQLREIRQALARLAESGAKPASELEYLRYAHAELAALDLRDGEIEALDQEQRQLAHAEQLLSDGGAVQMALNGDDDTAADLLGRLHAKLEDLSEIDAQFQDAVELLAAANIQVQEAADHIRRCLDRIDLDPARLQQGETRLQALHDMARKHQLPVSALQQRQGELAAQIEDSEGQDAKRQALLQQEQQALSAYAAAAEQLSKTRSKAAAKLSKAVTESARLLGMPQAKLEFSVSFDAQKPPRGHGQDEIGLEFTANPGQPPRSLAKVASGGELSRLSLAIQVAASRARTVPVMIFDEVDSGVGGAIAEIVGAKLRQLSKQAQVLCVTHLAQVAAQGHQHLQISKHSAKNSTRTQISPLAGAARTEELARMLGGVKLTDQTRAHAQEMLDNAKA